MQKAAEDLKKQQEREAEEKRKVIQARLPAFSLDGLNQCKLDCVHPWTSCSFVLLTQCVADVLFQFVSRDCMLMCSVETHHAIFSTTLHA